jgi:hypothetical protein
MKSGRKRKQVKQGGFKLLFYFVFSIPRTKAVSALLIAVVSIPAFITILSITRKALIKNRLTY